MVADYSVIVIENHLTSVETVRYLVDYMQEQADYIASLLHGGMEDVPGPELLNAERDLERFQARVTFYRAALDSLPDSTRLGDQTFEGHKFLQWVVEPVMFGWYPNDAAAYGAWATYSGVPEPFASQPPPFSSQSARAVPDFTTARRILLGLNVAAEAIADANRQLVIDLQDRAGAAVEVVKTVAGVGTVLAGGFLLLALSNAIGGRR
jgi:hypothetical protein